MCQNQHCPNLYISKLNFTFVPNKPQETQQILSLYLLCVLFIRNDSLLEQKLAILREKI